MANPAPRFDDILKAEQAGEAAALAALAPHAPGADARARAAAHAAALVARIRTTRPGLMEQFLAEYGLSTQEGIALMCLAEALLRVPDKQTMDELIEDKIAPSEWGLHLGQSSSSLVNASTWALMLTGRVLREDEAPGMAQLLHGAIKRLGEPVIRTAVSRAMKEMGHQFVLGRDIAEAVKRGAGRADQGYTFSYDMLGEAALTAADAARYHAAYAGAIRALAGQCKSADIRENPGISIKLSALHPRYEEGQRTRVLRELVPATLELALMAREAGMGLNIDAEEADRLALSLEVIEAVLADPRLAGWDGFGVVVQAYGTRAGAVLDWLHALAERLDRKIMVRLVKGAYWDAEIKRAQVEGLAHFPVFTRKPATDVSYICCAGKLLSMTGRIYPQFATHNAHSVAMILEMAWAQGVAPAAFEFQRLHGMGDSLHDLLRADHGTRCRIYAPVGAHRDLLAYLVRRLLENGANSSFVNQIVDESVPETEVAADPFTALEAAPPAALLAPADLYQPQRRNSKGLDLRGRGDLAALDQARSPFAAATWQAGPLMAVPHEGDGPHLVVNPADSADSPGQITHATAADTRAAIGAACAWQATAPERARILNRAADLYEQNMGEVFALLHREAGKTPLDAMAELREAVDFLRYYAAQALELPAAAAPRGRIACISPWNFPLAIFTGQIAAALAAGNAVLAKPAEATGLIAARACDWLHEAGVPRTALQFLPGLGGTVGAALSADARVDGLAFTGSTATAQGINRAQAGNAAPDAALIAETGGLNAMIVDSTALPEQAVRDIIASAFQSAGQRCSALRVLYLQEDIAEGFLTMLYGAMDELVLGNPWDLTTDIGPLIDARAKADFTAYIDAARAEGRVLKALAAPEQEQGQGHFLGPVVIKVPGIAALEREIFGPVLHVATFRAADLHGVVEAINASGFGLTLGLHSRIDSRVAEVSSLAQVGNLYVNRNQIGAVVGSQPFGGEGLSGTGPKAGGPSYLPRFCAPAAGPAEAEKQGSQPGGHPGAAQIDPAQVQARLGKLAAQPLARLASHDLPGPTGESNRLSDYGRGVVLCLGPTWPEARRQLRIAQQNGCPALAVAPGVPPELGLDGVLDPAALENLTGFALVALWSGGADGEGADGAEGTAAQTVARQALAQRDGPIIALACGEDLAALARIERHICIDTTAAGGNAQLLAAQG